MTPETTANSPWHNRTMTKSELMARLAVRYPELRAIDVIDVAQGILDTMTQSLAEGRRVEIRGFGSFDLLFRHPRIGRNPLSGQKVQVPAKYVVRFKVGKDMRAGVDSCAKKQAEKQSKAKQIEIVKVRFIV